MREIEIKVKVDDLKKVKKKLQDIGAIFLAEVTQEDEVFSNEKMSKSKSAIRIRQSGTKSLVTYKRNLSSELDCIEKETEVSNPEELKFMFIEMGLIIFAKVKKSRSKFKFNDYTICLDRVESLGSFIEVESLVEENEGEGFEENILKFLESLQVDITKRVFKGYDTLIREKKNLSALEPYQE